MITEKKMKTTKVGKVINLRGRKNVLIKQPCLCTCPIASNNEIKVS